MSLPCFRLHRLGDTQEESHTGFVTTRQAKGMTSDGQSCNACEGSKGRAAHVIYLGYGRKAAPENERFNTVRVLCIPDNWMATEQDRVWLMWLLDRLWKIDVQSLMNKGDRQWRKVAKPFEEPSVTPICPLQCLTLARRSPCAILLDLS
jgi:hypothetical protein